MNTISIYYFGGTEKGKRPDLFNPGMIANTNLLRDTFPFSWEMLYGGFCHADKKDLGEMTLTQVYGWTILSFWEDTTTISRVPWVANFIAPGSHSTIDMIDLALKHFPEVYRRVLPILKIREPSSPVA